MREAIGHSPIGIVNQSYNTARNVGPPDEFPLQFQSKRRPQRFAKQGEMQCRQGSLAPSILLRDVWRARFPQWLPLVSTAPVSRRTTHPTTTVVFRTDAGDRW